MYILYLENNDFCKKSNTVLIANVIDDNITI